MTESAEKKVEIKQERSEDTKVKKTEDSKETKEKTDLATLRNDSFPMLNSIEKMFSEMNRWFDDMFWRPSRIWNMRPFALDMFDKEPLFRTPLANITDEGDHFNLTAELPGLEKGDLEITIHDGMLEIKGEKKTETEEKDKGYIRKEYSSSSYYRSFAVPENVEEEKINATLEKGVLKLILPKKEEEKSEKKKIKVQ
ncbi:MAG: Hsp20/alpha crystallin family protein [Candidatus Lokiarchaeota archaeon]|nr:Hsp20/alpha crystallin family protein [Candidatus Lokiarchaeota archaeon]